MPVITIFVILLVAVFATLVYFTEPSAGDKRTRERLAALSRQTAVESEEGILREITFSRIAAVDRLLRNNRFALQLELMLDQAKVPWTVGRFFFYSAVLMVVGSTVGHWWIPVGSSAGSRGCCWGACRWHGSCTSARRECVASPRCSPRQLT